MNRSMLLVCVTVASFVALYAVLGNFFPDTQLSADTQLTTVVSPGTEISVTGPVTVTISDSVWFSVEYNGQTLTAVQESQAQYAWRQELSPAQHRFRVQSESETVLVTIAGQEIVLLLRPNPATLWAVTIGLWCALVLLGYTIKEISQAPQPF